MKKSQEIMANQVFDFLRKKLNNLFLLIVVREKAQLIVDLLKNKDILEEHRKNLKNLQEKVLKKSITKTDIFFNAQL